MNSNPCLVQAFSTLPKVIQNAYTPQIARTVYTLVTGFFFFHVIRKVVLERKQKSFWISFWVEDHMPLKRCTSLPWMPDYLMLLIFYILTWSLMEQQLTKHTEENYSKSLVKRFMEIKVCYVQMQQKLTYAVINTCLINGNYH